HALYADDVDAIVPAVTLRDQVLEDPEQRERGFDSAIVLVDDQAHLKQVVEQIDKLGLNQHSLINFVEHIQKHVALVTGIIAVLAGVALLVSALGITNTMIMSVLERTREIGILKAVGARDGQVQLMFLAEGALIGLTGGLLGLAAAWLATFPGEAIAAAIVEAELHRGFEGPLFVFPPWLVLGVPLFSTVVTTLAGLYPARRAAKVDPIAALRHE
ncbi:MAG: ABC transporter permease, partial [Planctomycetes bacterium]|nr:ABC transporter permease [Planctomycetota bacterium]